MQTMALLRRPLRFSIESRAIWFVPFTNIIIFFTLSLILLSCTSARTSHNVIAWLWWNHCEIISVVSRLFQFINANVWSRTREKYQRYELSRLAHVYICTYLWYYFSVPVEASGGFTLTCIVNFSTF